MYDDGSLIDDYSGMPFSDDSIGALDTQRQVETEKGAAIISDQRAKSGKQRWQPLGGIHDLHF